MAHQRKHHDRYQVRWRDSDGRERAKAFALKRDADRFEKTLEADLLRGVFVDPRLGAQEFGDWATAWMRGRASLRPSTRARDESYLRSLILPTFQDRTLAAVRPEDVRTWIAGLAERGKAPATIRKAYQLLAASFGQAVNDGLIPRSPCRGIDLPRPGHTEMRFLTVDEVERLADAIGERWRAMVLVGAYTGLRFGEAAGLRASRVDLLRRRLEVTDTLTEVRGHVALGPPKTEGSRRSVSIPRRLVTAFEEHMAAFPPGVDGLIFTGVEGGPLRRSLWQRRVWLPAVRASVGEPCRFHDLRHTHAALLIAQNEHPKLIQARLGHASISTTLNVYGHLFTGLDEQAADRLDQAVTASRRNAAADHMRTSEVGRLVALPH